MSEKKFALIVANYEFEDSRLQKLTSPAKDAEALAKILQDPDIGNFNEIILQVNQSASVLRKEIISFFSKRMPDDMLLFYYSGHGIMDSRGRLYLATKDTEMESPKATAIQSSYIGEEMDESRSNRQILIVDCCYSGALMQGAKSGVGTKINVDTFAGNGYGRVILTATDAVQLAWEGDRIDGEVNQSLFTHYFIEGITTGNATPYKELISVDDIYNYIYKNVRSYQNPQKKSSSQEGELIIARNPKPRIKIHTSITGISSGKQEFVGDSSVFGIDFGTTKSAISIIHDGKPIIIRNDRGEKFTPSVVTFMKNGDVVVGTPAIIQAFSSPETACFAIKREIEKDLESEFNNKKYTSITIASKIFESLKKSAQKYCKDEKYQAVICTPAYFSSKQKSAISAAAAKAGFEVLRMIPEPVSIALAYNVEKNNNVVVCDLGGGTFDVSLLQLGDGVVQVMSVNGDNLLGGLDFDNKIVEFIIKDFLDKYKIDLSHDGIAKIRLMDAAEQAKIVLSELENVNIFVPNIYADQDGVKNINIVLARDDFEIITKDLIDKVEACCLAAYKDLELWGEKIDKVLLSGLSTQIPAVRKSIINVFKINSDSEVDPNDAVAIGAAIHGGVLSGIVKDILLLQATEISLGIELFDGTTHIFIERSTTIPTRNIRMFHPHNEGQTKVAVNIIQGGDVQGTIKEILGTVMLDNIASVSKPEIEVVFDIDANGTLTVKIREKSTNRESRRVFNILKEDTYERNPKNSLILEDIQKYSLDFVRDVSLDEYGWSKNIVK